MTVGIEIRYGYYGHAGRYVATVQIIDHTDSDKPDQWLHASGYVEDTQTAMQLAKTMAHSIMEMMRLFGAIESVIEVSNN